MGRYSITKRRKDVEREVASKLRVRLGGGDEVYERFNVAPTQDVPAVVQDRHGRRSEVLRWGLVPRWARELNTGPRRSSTRARRRWPPAARSAGWWSARRTAAWSWPTASTSGSPRRTPSSRGSPLRFSLEGGGSFCFAGLWTTWRSSVRSCTVVTTQANELVAPVHDRMPVVLADPAAWEAWLDPALDAAAVAPLLAPLPAGALEVAPANPVLNHPDHEGPDCLVVG